MLGADASVCSGKMRLEGRVVKRAECRPPASIGYLRMKMYAYVLLLFD